MPNRPGGVAIIPAATASISIVDIPKHRLLECTAIMQLAFGFNDLATTPPAMLYTHAEYGGINLGAFEDDVLVGWVPAFPARQSGKVFLFSAGLSVSPERQSAGVGGLLMNGLARAGRERGYDSIRWTTNLVSSRNLYLYLRKCGAEVIAFRPLMYEGLNDSASPEGVEGDEVEIEWDLTRLDQPAPWGHSSEPHLLTVTEDIGDGLRRLSGTAFASHSTVPHTGPCSVEVPWNAEELAKRDAGLVTSWRQGLASVLPEFLKDGYRGVDVLLDKAQRRSFVIFARAD